MPPKKHLTTMIANALPITATHIGAVGGILNANNIPVTTALKSYILIGLLVIFEINIQMLHMK